MLYPRESANREVKNLDGFWTFCPDKNDIGEKEGFCGGEFSGDVREAAVPASYNEQFDDLLIFTARFGMVRNFLSLRPLRVKQFISDLAALQARQRFI